MAQDQLPLRDLIGIPLADLVKAEAMAAHETHNFLNEFGWDTAKKGDKEGNLKTVTFSFLRKGNNDELIRHEVSVPLITLIPIPLLQIEKVSIDLSVKISGVNKDEIVGFYDNLNQAANPKDKSPKINLKIEVKQSDVPSGILQTLRRLELANTEDINKIK